MKGSIDTIRDGVHRLRFDVGSDPTTGRRRQKMITFKGTKKQAEQKLRDHCSAVEGNTYVEPQKLKLGDWLIDWLRGSVEPRVREATHVRYKGIIENYIGKAPIASIPLQKLRPTHLEAYYASLRDKVSGATLTLHHAILHRALRKAVRDRLIATNPAIDLEGKPRRSHNREDAREHAWTAEEARTFLKAAKAAGTQPAAFYALALDSGMRKGELCGLKWENVDLDGATVRVVEQLLSPTVAEDGTMKLGPTKTGKVRTISIGAETVTLLRAHRKAQRELRMANRTTYHDLGLVFAKEWGEVRKRGDVLGHPLQMNNLGEREYARLIKAADVKRIKFHGLRHTCATLLLQAHAPVHVVSERLGHAKVSMTLEVYAHVLPNMQRDAASTLDAVLHG